MEPVLRWLVLISGLASVGGLGFQLLVSRPVFSGMRNRTNWRQLGAKLESRTSKLIWVSIAVFLLASLVQLLLQAAVVHDIPLYQVVGSPWVSILTDTSWGHFWLWRVGLLLAMAAVLGGTSLGFPWRGLRGRETNAVSQLAWLLAMFMGVGMLFTLSLTSHGAATVQVRTWALFSDYLHLLAATFWVGGLFHLAAGIPLILQMLAPAQRRVVLSALMPRLSFVAILSFGTLVVTGLYNAWAQVTVLEGITTPYGWTLVAKVGAVILLLALGAVNLLWVRPRLSGQDGAALWLRRLVYGEVGLALLVLFLVGVLASLEPARQVASQEALAGQDRITFQDKVEGLDVGLAVEPGKVGPNQVSISLQDRLGKPVTNASEVRVGLVYLDTDVTEISMVAVQTDPGRYLLSDEVLSLGGNWQVELLVRRPDNLDARTAFRFFVGGGASVGSPSEDLGRLLWGVELVLLGFLLIAVGIPLGGWWKPSGAVVMGSGLAVFVVGLLIAFNTYLVGTDQGEILRNPFPPNAESLTQGSQVFAANCQSCHGINGLGDGPLAAGMDPPPADLTVHVPFQFDRSIFGFVENGIPGTGMPPLGDVLTEEEIWHVTNYIKTFDAAEK